MLAVSNCYPEAVEYGEDDIMDKDKKPGGRGAGWGEERV